MRDASCVLEVQDFGLALGSKVVLESVSFTLPAVGCSVLWGAAGVGKSVLMRTLAGLNARNGALRTWGQAWYIGAPCSATHHPLMTIQSAQLLISNVLDCLTGDMAERSQLTRSMQRERVEQALHDYGCTDLMADLSLKVVDLPLHTQRAVMILRMLMARPALICLDDPLQGLTEAQIPRLRQLLERVSDERALLLTQGVRSPPLAIEGAHIIELVRPCESQPREPQLRIEEPRPDPVPVPTLPPVGLGHVLAASWARSHTRKATAGPSGFHWLLPQKLAGTPWPGVVHDVRYDLDVLRTVGITCLISLTESPFDPVLAAEFGLRCIASPMPDMHPPSFDQAVDLCRAIDHALSAGDVVAVHCYAGLGRTGTVLVAYALWCGRGQQTGAQALAAARRIHPGWVQSQVQMDFLNHFAQALAAGQVVFDAVPDL